METKDIYTTQSGGSRSSDEAIGPDIDASPDYAQLEARRKSVNLNSNLAAKYV
jgi:hypothetical protein